MATIEILATGMGLSIQDQGRSGWRRYGVPPGGAMDRYAAQTANRLLGNSKDAPVLEILMQGAQLRVLEDTWVALTGADLGSSIRPWTACRVQAGTILTFPVNRSGLWAYLAVLGGIESEYWFGSASVDTRNGLGRRLECGDYLSAVVSGIEIPYSGIGRRVLRSDLQPEMANANEFELLPGPQFEQFTEAARAELVGSQWTVAAQSDRTGYRLSGPVLEVPDSILSEPVLPGSLQIPGNGQPIITMIDGPTVGGYAKIAILQEADLDHMAQCRPGTELKFRWKI
jgi:biotin-dependent carboxylase-like uncharacterized protein